MKKLAITLFCITLFSALSAQTYKGTFFIDSDSIEIIHSSSDLFGNTIVVGTFTGTTDFNPSQFAIANLTSTSNSRDIFVAKYTIQGVYNWAFKLGNINKEIITGLHVDRAGNIIIAGKITGFVDMNPGTGIAGKGTSSTSSFLAKYDINGLYQWANVFDATHTISHISCDQSNNIFTAGTFSGVVDFNPSASSFSLIAAGNDIFLARYNAGGVFNFVKKLGNSFNEELTGLDQDKYGNLYLTGTYLGTLDFNLSTGVSNMTSTASADVFFVKYTASLGFIWAKSINGTAQVKSKGIKVDTLGNVYVSGLFTGVIDANPSSFVNNVTSASQSTDDIFLSKYNGSGNFQWVNRFGNTNAENLHSFLVDKLGGIILYGSYKGTMDANPGGGIKYLTSSGTSPDLFVIKIRTAGTYHWAFNLGNVAAEKTFSSHIDLNDDFFVCGLYSGLIDFDPSTSWSSNYTAIGWDGFLSKYASYPASRNEAEENEDENKNLTESENPIENENLTLKLYPNPCQGVFNISMSKITEESLLLSVYDLAGRLVYNQNITNSAEIISVNLTNLTRGMYIVNILGNKVHFIEKVVIE